jgi:gliding motility-associated-like protein
MKIKLIRLAKIALVTMTLASAARAQTVYNPVAVTGYTDDVVADLPGAAQASANNDMDGGAVGNRFCFIASTYRTPAGAIPQTSLPAAGLVVSQTLATAGLTFQMGPYTGRNSMRINGIGTGTLTLVTPRAAREVWLLGGSGNGTSTYTATITFTDGTVQAFANQTFLDWFGATANIAIRGVSRVNFDTNALQNSTNDPSLYQTRLPLLPANYSKLIRSVTFTKATVLGTFNVLGISVGSGCTSAPSAGRAVASQTTLCPPASTVLSLSSADTDPSMTYQWQSSLNGTTWTDIATATAPTYTASPSVTTQYRARLLCGLLPAVSTPVTVTIAVVPSTISYSTTTFCQAGSSPVPTATPAGGTFSGSPGLVIDATTGIINLAQSSIGPHTISYQNASQCATVATTTIVIATTPAAIGYSSPSYCQFGNSPAPSATPAGGTFTGTSGLVLDAATGVINLAQSSPGAHVITYNGGGQCPSQTTATVQIDAAARNIIFPNVLTPNSDGFNDKLVLQLPTVGSYQISVYNRWGRTVWEGSEATQGWEAPTAGIYYYKVSFTDCTGQPQTYKGWVEVIK